MKGYWKLPGAPVWCPTLKGWFSCMWARWVLYGGLGIRR